MSEIPLFENILVKYPVLLIEDDGRIVKDEELRLNTGDLKNGGLRNKIKDGELLIDDVQSRFDVSILPHQHLLNITSGHPLV